MSILLEVIVTSMEEAIEAQLGGADRLEVVRALDEGGLTPEVFVVESILSSVSIPARVMIRERDSMELESDVERGRLQRSIDQFTRYPIDGLVLGFNKGGLVDEQLMAEFLPDDLQARVTFHRAFDEVVNPLQALNQLGRFRQIDHVLTRAGEGSIPQRRARLEQWQRAALPNTKMIFAIGRDTWGIAELQSASEVFEVHVGRAARIPTENSGVVSRSQVAALKNSTLLTTGYK